MIHSRIRLLVWYSLIVILLSGSAFAAEIRQPAAAGTYYSSIEAELGNQIIEFLSNVPEQKSKAKLIALIVPHAGYDYSGQVAAYAYKELDGKKFKRVILISNSHHQRFDSISVGEYDYYQTPLGRVKVDKEFIDRLVHSSDRISFLRKAHDQEHSLEVQLPFLQTMLADEFKIVPIIFGNASFANCQILAFSLAKLVDDETLIICSTDWSHYHKYDQAVIMDKLGIEAVLDNDIEKFADLLTVGSSEACGMSAIITTMLLAPSLGANRIKLLNYANLGDVTGDKSRVVGYASIAYVYESSPLSATDKEQLLKIARQTLEKHLAGENMPVVEVDPGVLTERRGAFVTLNKHGQLRGCIGYIQPVKPLAEAVQAMAIAAATKDMRFKPVEADELKDIEIEISVLSRLEKVKKTDEIKIGRDGLYIIKGRQGGLLLPQVATDNKWDKKEFLENVCYKAGLPKNAWKEDSILYRFSADIFYED